MKKYIENIRLSNQGLSMKKKIINSALIFFFGVLLGIFSKWLDNLSINDSILWQHIIGVLDLNNIFSSLSIWLFLALVISVYSNSFLRASINVFLFFIGMTISYHLYTIIFSGFNPKSYMMIWYIITLLSPILASICWYAKANNKISIIISGLILSIMVINCFNIGFWYFYLKNLIDLLLFIGVIIILYTKPKNIVCSLLIGFLMAYIIRFFI